MAIVAVVGDACTTTTVALASAWPAASDALIVEADPAGGDLAAWFDMPVLPSLSTAVTRAFDATWAELDRYTRITPSGLRLIPAPSSATEAERAVAESSRALVPVLASLRSPIAIADAGDVPTGRPTHPFLSSSAVTVVVHRQRTQSARAAAVRLQRLADALEAMTSASAPVVVAVIGGEPFSLAQIESFLSDASGASWVMGLPVDDLTAAVYAGRTGVSARRLARLPLARAARDLAGVVDAAVRERSASLSRSPR